jgi:hypothetical protein
LKKFLFAAITFVISVGVLASTLTITDKAGKKMGTAIYSFTNASGKLTTKLVMTMEQQGVKVVVDETNVYSAAGDPLTLVRITTGTVQGKSTKSTTKVTFSGKKATEVETMDGKTNTTPSTAPGSVNDKSMVWLSGKLPAIGTSTEFYSYETHSARWIKATTKYHGTRTVNLSKGAVTAHVITQTRANETMKIYFTANGDLLRLEAGDFIASQ